jgi:hypothetical protein
LQSIIRDTIKGTPWRTLLGTLTIFNSPSLGNKKTIGPILVILAHLIGSLQNILLAEFNCLLNRLIPRALSSELTWGECMGNTIRNILKA